MTKRKRPEGEEFEDFCKQWDENDHEHKIRLAADYGVTYDTMKHWRSESEVPTRKQVKTIFSPPVKPPKVNVPLLFKTKSGISTAAIIGDTHNPYQDVEVIEVVENFLEQIQPDYLFYNGDINDFYQVSVFAKDPSRLGELQSDIDTTTAMFDRHSTAMPNTQKIFIEGTHENRWFKYLQDKAPAVSKLRSTNISELYKLEEFNISYVPFERGVLVNGVFLILHGDIVSVYSSYTAKRHFEKNGGSGMCNHTHRGGSFYKRDRFGMWGWWENFCLCSLNPDWIQNPNWQQGFSLVHFSDSGRFWVEQIPIVDNKFIYGGKIYG
uniref:Calcineurin-like phosphoesterase domain-containing protein n=1 Tax=viral metagenome TaxID=1070528 RepID=A0A6M3IRM6_9ZZZZ